MARQHLLWHPLGLAHPRHEGSKPATTSVPNQASLVALRFKPAYRRYRNDEGDRCGECRDKGRRKIQLTISLFIAMGSFNGFFEDLRRLLHGDFPALQLLEDARAIGRVAVVITEEEIHLIQPLADGSDTRFPAPFPLRRGFCLGSGETLRTKA